MLAAASLALALFLPAPVVHRSAPRASCQQPRCRLVLSEQPDFDDTLRGLLGDAEAAGSMEKAVDSWLERLDDTFIPELGARISDTDPSAADLPKMNELMASLQDRSEQRFTRARDQLQKLLTAGEINKMDSQLAGLVRKNEIDAGFFYVLLRNLEDAERDGDEGGARLMSHIHTRLQELLEGEAEPALALLHKLTRLDQPSIRFNLLRANLVPQTEAPLPGGGVLPLATPAPASVEPMDLAAAIEGALDKVRRHTHTHAREKERVRAHAERPAPHPPCSPAVRAVPSACRSNTWQVFALTVDPAAKEATAQEIRTVAIEARTVVEEAYDAEVRGGGELCGKEHSTSPAGLIADEPRGRPSPSRVHSRSLPSPFTASASPCPPHSQPLLPLRSSHHRCSRPSRTPSRPHSRAHCRRAPRLEASLSSCSRYEQGL